MAIKIVQQNLAMAMQKTAMELLALRGRMKVIKAMWVTEGMNALIDEDIQALGTFTHITIAELTAANNAMDAIATTVGEYDVGTNATKLVKIIENVPG